MENPMSLEYSLTFCVFGHIYDYTCWQSTLFFQTRMMNCDAEKTLESERCHLSIDREVFIHWKSVGKTNNYVTDSQIASFLLSL